MFGALSVAGIVAGSALSYGAKWFKPHTDVLETCAGVLLIAGLGLLGAILPHLA
jgi:hypothetical protein